MHSADEFAQGGFAVTVLDLLNDIGCEQVMDDIVGWIETHVEMRMPLVT